MNKWIMGVLMMGAMITIACTNKQAATGLVFTENDGIFFHKVDKIEVYMLVEAQREGNAGILIGADEALLSQFIPESGFTHSTNVFLIKANGRNILVDTGFGTTIFEKMAKIGVQPDQVDAVLMTHLHGDHIGGLAKDGAALLPNATLYVSTLEREYFTEIQVNDGAVAALAAYGNKVVSFDPGELGATLSAIIPGISPIAAYGHTPGHTAYLVEDGKDTLLIAGDFLHVGLVQFPNPAISAIYDVDPEAAAATRIQLLRYAAEQKIPIGGMHIVYPGIGTVEPLNKGFMFTAQ